MNADDALGGAYSLKLTYEGSEDLSADLAAAFERTIADIVRSADGVCALDLFVPDQDRPVLFDNEGPPPALHVEIGLADIAAVQSLVATPEFSKAAADLASRADSVFGVDLYRVHRTTLPGASAPEARKAPMSFIVRYYGPTEDPAAFARHYIAHHPDLLARFPKVRNVLCYEPVDWDAAGLPRLSVIVGNEVVFDDVATLNAAMLSPVMKDLRKDSAAFPAFGHSTHHPMRRRGLIDFT